MTAPITENQDTLHLGLSEVVRTRLERQRRFATAHRERFARLSRREVEVLTLISQGKTNRAIAGKLFLSVHTVRTHRQNIRRQLGIHGVVEAVWWGQSFGLV